MKRNKKTGNFETNVSTGLQPEIVGHSTVDGGVEQHGNDECEIMLVGEHPKHQGKGGKDGQIINE
jgi:hypothetical protein